MVVGLGVALAPLRLYRAVLVQVVPRSRRRPSARGRGTSSWYWRDELCTTGTVRRGVARPGTAAPPDGSAVSVDGPKATNDPGDHPADEVLVVNFRSRDDQVAMCAQRSVPAGRTTVNQLVSGLCISGARFQEDCADVARFHGVSRGSQSACTELDPAGSLAAWPSPDRLKYSEFQLAGMASRCTVAQSSLQVDLKITSNSMSRRILVVG